VLAAVTLLAAAWDVSRAPDRQVAAKMAIAGVHVYQATLARVFAATGTVCRFNPTCSHYGEAVLRHYGVLRGGWLAARRVLRCGPWTPLGTSDPPPTGT
jgi:putative membrane protein insertion efficiency factor